MLRVHLVSDYFRYLRSYGGLTMQEDPHWRLLGVILQTGLGSAYPALKDQAQALYRDKVSRLPFVPKDWLDNVRELQAINGGDVVLLAPSRTALGIWSVNNPEWMDTNDKVLAWEAVRNEMQEAVKSYARADAARGAVIIAGLQRNAAFWSGLYDVASVVGAAPNAIIGAAGDVASGAVSTLIKRAWLPLVLIGLGAFIYFNKGALTAAALKKMAGK